MSKLVKILLVVLFLTVTVGQILYHHYRMNLYHEARKPIIDRYDSCVTQFDRMQRELYSYPDYQSRRLLYDSMAKNLALRSELTKSLEQIKLP